MLDDDVRAQELADPDSLRHARTSAGERMEVLTELIDEYSTTLESILAVLRSGKVDDSAARSAATAVAASGLVHLRTASDRVRTSAEEPVTTAFERLREDLRPLVHYRDIDVQFVEPPEDGRPLPSEVAHGARAVVRGSVLALLESPEVGRVRVQWDCDGTNLLIDMRDDGHGDITAESVSVQSVSQRIHALGGRIAITATAGWGTEIAIAIPLDPPHVAPGSGNAWDLRPREHEVLRRLAAGRRNREIAADLGISENTVKFHIANIYRKLDVTSRSEATALFLRA
ncbi:LuxR C-terminal-related transcriptional regulator [Microbacterium sp.]|uniref:helix-turn-helix transcriptional regulator n=1 Tax=Microbacterium sp. TaxID=51671 RepID=UPI003F983C33